MPIKKIVFLLLICLPLFLHAQKKEGKALADSLLNELPKAKEDTNKVKLLNALANEYYSVDLERGLKYAREALDLAKKLQFKRGIANAYSTTGVIYGLEGNYPQAMEYHRLALKVAEDIHNRKMTGACYFKVGNVFYCLGNYPDALNNYFLALKINEELGVKAGIAGCYNNIGMIYESQKNNSEALKI